MGSTVLKLNIIAFMKVHFIAGLLLDCASFNQLYPINWPLSAHLHSQKVNLIEVTQPWSDYSIQINTDRYTLSNTYYNSVDNNFFSSI